MVLATLIALLFAQLGSPIPNGTVAVVDQPVFRSEVDVRLEESERDWFPPMEQQVVPEFLGTFVNPPMEDERSKAFQLTSMAVEIPGQPSPYESDPYFLADPSGFPADPSGFDSVLSAAPSESVGNKSHHERYRWRLLRSLLTRKLSQDYGLGYERVMFAPMTIDTAVSSPYVGLRIRSDRGLGAADRLEYLWARSGRGPAPESRVDLVDYVYRTELGNEKAALISELGMRALNPEVNANTVGFGDMLLGGKALVYDGKCTKLSSIFLTHLNTGPTNRGLGTGHISLEPGLLIRHQWSDATFLHGELKYRLPIAGTADFAGDVLNTGWAISTIWRDSDQMAWMPTLEFQTHSFLFGGRTLLDGSERRVDSVTAMDIFPGLRCAFARSAMGTWEAGLAGGVTLADRDWFDTRMVFEIRWLK